MFSHNENIIQITCFAYMYGLLNNHQMFLWKVTRQICDTLIFFILKKFINDTLQWQKDISNSCSLPSKEWNWHRFTWNITHRNERAIDQFQRNTFKIFLYILSKFFLLVKSCITINVANTPKTSLLQNTVLKILLPFQTTWVWTVLHVGSELKLRQKQAQCEKWSSQCTQALTSWFKQTAKAE